MSIIEKIRREHQESLASLKEMSQLARHLEKGAPLKVEQVLDVVASTLDFNNRCHHFKEEKLFQLLALKLDENEIPLLMELEAEHKASDELLKNINRQILQTVPQIPLLKNRIVEILWTFVELNRRHIDKEEKRFLPLFEGLVTRDEQVHLLEYFQPRQSTGPILTLPTVSSYLSKEL
ncbi:MAG: hypothetical protein GX751_09230 [Desulfuromonadaceae bacterium]|nr:hypothetical protein [Desulfuromonadaceae bacterium]